MESGVGVYHVTGFPVSSVIDNHITEGNRMTHPITFLSRLYIERLDFSSLSFNLNFLVCHDTGLLGSRFTFQQSAHLIYHIIDCTCLGGNLCGIICIAFCHGVDGSKLYVFISDTLCNFLIDGYRSFNHL